VRRWPDDIETLLEYPLVLATRDAGGSRTHSKAALQAAAVPSGSSVIVSASSPGIEPGPQPSHGRMPIQHTPRTETTNVEFQMTKRQYELRIRRLRTSLFFRHLTFVIRHSQYPDLDLNQGLDLRRVQCKSATPSGHEHEREELNPVKQFWRLPALPGAHSCMLPIPRWAARVSEGS
jgi:hypothetical protein